MTQPTLEQLEAILAPYQQQHLLAGWDTLDPTRRDQFARQLMELDFDQLAAQQQSDQSNDGPEAAEFEPASAIRLDQASSHTLPASDRGQARMLGEAALRDGRLAMVLVAGGQGSRLGVAYPKCMLPVGPLSERSLMEMVIDQLLAVGRRYDVEIPLRIMTSPAVHQQTAEFLDQHRQFGMSPGQCQLFCQAVLPTLDSSNGSLLLAEPGQLLTNPDGHGGLVQALQASGLLSEFEELGADLLFYAQVDNPLVQVCQPEFIGHHLAADSEMTTQVVAKTHGLERTGNLVSHAGQLRVVEYSELPSALAEQCEEDGSLRFWAGSIAVHLFNRQLLEQAAGQADWLPLHRAQKQVECLPPASDLLAATERTAIKFERFIFDLLPRATNPLLVEVERQAAFAPIKNDDSAESDTAKLAQQAIVNLHRSWLLAAGVRIDDDLPIEIHPGWARDAEQVRQRTDLPDSISEPTYLASDRDICEE